MPVRTGWGDTIDSDICIDRTDLILLDALQDDFPLVAKPWDLIATRIGISVGELLSRLLSLQECGIIRGIIPALESRKFGLKAGTLVAIHMPDNRHHEITEIINSYSEVSHNYLREHYYSVWFTISAPTEERISEILSDIMQRTGVMAEDIINLPTICKYKIDVRFTCFTGDENFGQD
ncbi:Lrp/AsnC family transcriptional regulator [Methanoplanus limicola]|uniref:siroheme decarboxylase n=1 Tax=Methanoplanus limicola DSM 2279 TaxID=937775 RepID=H1Z410_9EURY|nr:Lrp/AsnC family transcriptional regulator [Methanoplanus limicola]EHQ35689.1 transcriptional regulator, AsnC family [Methanoplanus limicola DSM 2279]